MQETKLKEKTALLIFTDTYQSPKKTELSISKNPKTNVALQEIEEEELKSLTKTIFIQPLASMRFKVNKVNPASFVGKGQLEKIAMRADAEEVDVVIFNNDLSPRVRRNLEEALGLCVIDRREVIIQIFADRAQSREAVLQARLAQLEYSMPRLTRQWTELAQQRGGVKGSKGAGEKKLELDKRRLRSEIAKLKAEVKKVRTQRNVQRKSRMSNSKKIGAIVGYTNAGKSSLLKKLSGTDIFAENKLFATLDAETRKIFIQNEKQSAQFLLTDTVGFVSKLPHQLIDAFHSTLEEAELADFLIIVCDASHPAMRECLEVSNSVLEELNCNDKPKLIVINKSDSIFDPTEVMLIKEQHPQAIEISLKNGTGLDKLNSAIIELIENL